MILRETNQSHSKPYKIVPSWSLYLGLFKFKWTLSAKISDYTYSIDKLENEILKILRKLCSVLYFIDFLFYFFFFTWFFVLSKLRSASLDFSMNNLVQTAGRTASYGAASPFGMVFWRISSLKTRLPVPSKRNSTGTILQRKPRWTVD